MTDDPAGPFALRFAMIPEWVLFHPDLDAQDVRVFGALHLFAQRSPAIATIGEHVYVSADTVRRSIRNLERLGVIFTEPQFGSNGEQLPNRYRIAAEVPA